jgi:Holliday junction resolvase RusA-like endonuclease
MTISFTVSGIPKGQPRPRAFAFKGKARIFDSGTAEGWKSEIALAARPHLPAEPLAGPLVLSVDFYFPRPKKHFLKAGLRLGAPTWFCSKPDADNAAKAVMDALTQLGLWRDDAQVVSLIVRKTFGAAAQVGARVTVASLEKLAS